VKNKYFLLFTLFLFLSLTVQADFVSLIRADKCETIIEIFVEDGQIRVTYEIGLKDWKYFKGIIPDDLSSDETREYLKSEDINYFFNNVFILNADGNNLIGKIVNQKVVPRKYRSSLYTGVIDKNTNVSKQVLYTEIVYPIRFKPNKIVITPPVEEGFNVTKANIGFVTYHKKIPVNDLRFLGQQATLNLNWKDPWYSKFNNIILRRHHQSSLMSFLYVDPYEVRHEVLIRVKDLEEWMDLGFLLDDYIEVEEQEELKDKIAQFLKSRNIVTIDGKVGDPIIDKVHFVKWSLAGIKIQEIKERMDYSSAVIGVIFAYPHENIAQKISINWDMFSENILVVPNVATDPVGPMPYNLMQDDHILVWTNYLKKYKLPTISEVEVVQAKVYILHLVALIVVLFSLYKIYKNKRKVFIYGVLVIFGTLLILMEPYSKISIAIPFFKQSSFSRPEASLLVNHLLKNTYRAFDFRKESDVYDKLAISYDEGLLADIYLRTKKSMVLEGQGGIQVKVKDVEVLEVEEVSTDNDGISFKCKWIVKGDVGHWGHIHSRVNQYEAILNVHPVNGVWKLNAIDIIEEVRLY